MQRNKFYKVPNSTCIGHLAAMKYFQGASCQPAVFYPIGQTCPLVVCVRPYVNESVWCVCTVRAVHALCEWSLWAILMYRERERERERRGVEWRDNLICDKENSVYIFIYCIVTSVSRCV